MKLYGIIYENYQNGVDAYAVTEEGVIIEHHFCSSENFAKSDLGFGDVYLPSSETFNKETKSKYLELGYDELIWLGNTYDDFSNNLRDIIFDINQEYMRLRDTCQDSVTNISKMAEQGKLVSVKGIDWTVESSDLPLEELKVKNAYASGLLYSNFTSMKIDAFSIEVIKNRQKVND